jgi:hypothetical protein
MKARFQRAFRILREQGKHTGNHLTVPRTVRYVRERDANGKVTSEHWELVPEAVERIKQAFHLLFTTNDSYDTIALKVGWSGGNALRRLMQNPVHVGIRRYTILHDGPEYKPEPTLKHPKPKKRRKQRNREIPVDYPTREEIETGQRQPIVQPILTWAQWDKAEALFRERAANPKKRRYKEDDSDRPRFLAAGIGYCSCGQPLYGQQSAHRLGRQYGNWDHYKCHSRRPKSLLDRGAKGPGCGAPNVHRRDLDSAVETLMSKLADEDFILAAVKTIVDQQEEAPDPGRAIREQARKDFQAGRRNLLRLVQENKISSQEFAENSAELEQKLKALEAMTPAPMPKLDPLEIAERIARVFVSFQFMAYKDKRNVLSGAVKRIIVDTTTRRIVGVTVSGGYLGHGATVVDGTVDSVHRRRTPYQIDRTPDLILHLPQPIEIPKLARAA